MTQERQDFPQMIYHKWLGYKVVNDKDELKVYEAKGWRKQPFTEEELKEEIKKTVEQEQEPRPTVVKEYKEKVVKAAKKVMRQTSEPIRKRKRGRPKLRK